MNTLRNETLRERLETIVQEGYVNKATADEVVTKIAVAWIAQEALDGNPLCAEIEARDRVISTLRAALIGSTNIFTTSIEDPFHETCHRNNIVEQLNRNNAALVAAIEAKL